MYYRAEIHNTLDGSTRRYTFEATNLDHASRKLSFVKGMFEVVDSLIALNDIDCMYNSGGDIAEIHTRVNGTVDVYIEIMGREIRKQYDSIEEACMCLGGMGFEI